MTASRFALAFVLLVPAGCAARPEPALDGGADATTVDARADGKAFDAGLSCEALAPLEPATLPALPPSCAPCPATLPEAGSPCSPDKLDCEYGSDPRLGCNATVECSPNKGWQIIFDGGPAPYCEQPERGGACDLGPEAILAGDCLEAGTSCLTDAGVCVQGFGCEAVRTAAVGCPCQAGAYGSIRLTEHLGVECSDAGILRIVVLQDPEP